MDAHIKVSYYEVSGGKSNNYEQNAEASGCSASVALGSVCFQRVGVSLLGNLRQSSLVVRTQFSCMGQSFRQKVAFKREELKGFSSYRAELRILQSHST